MKIPTEYNTSAPESKKHRKNRLLAMLLMIVLVIGTTVCLLLFISSPKTNNIISGELFPGNGEAVEGHLPKMTDAEIREQMQREADRSVFSFKINSRPIFVYGGSEGTLNIENPNHNLYPFVVEIFLDETGEKLYDSGGIPPNHHISRARLARILPKGEHAATAYINAYDPDTNKYSGKSAVGLVIIISN